MTFEKIVIVVTVIAFLYLRRSIKLILENRRIDYLIGLYESYRKAVTNEEKQLAFEEIARNKSLSNDLINSFWFNSPGYKDFNNEEKIRNTFIELIETFNHNSYWMKKYLNPKFVIKDIFYLPSSILGFLLNHQFKILSSIFISSLGWIATILISAYAAELRALIDAIIK